MAEAKQSYLNGAYYGPPVPPPERRRRYRSVGRSTDCCCGLPFCLLSTLFKLIVSIIILVGAAVLVIWLVIHPNKIKADVDSATLTTFKLSTASPETLTYALSLNVSIRNPNKHIGIYYDFIQAQAFYSGTQIGSETLPPFYQGHKNTTTISPAFGGGPAVFISGDGGSVSSTYSRETGEGFYYVDVKIYTNVRLKVWIFKIHGLKPKIDCSVKLPVPVNGTSAAVSFQTTGCDVDY